MISVIYWIVNIVLSLIFQSWTLFIVLGIIWLLWMIFRALAKNGIGADDYDSWWFFDDFEYSSRDFFDFGGGEFGGGGGSGDWGDSGDSSGDGGD